MSHELSPYFLTGLLVGAVVLLILATFPFRMLKLAWRNCLRLDGSRSPFRTRRELKKFADLLASLFLLPLLAFGLFGGTITLVHEYVVPIPIVSDIFGAFDPDPLRWEAAIERGELGDLGEKYEQWSLSRGYSFDRARFWQDFLWGHWLGLSVLALLFGAAGYWFLTQFYFSSLERYYRGLLYRQKKYRKRDFRRVL